MTSQNGTKVFFMMARAGDPSNREGLRLSAHRMKWLGAILKYLLHLYKKGWVDSPFDIEDV